MVYESDFLVRKSGKKAESFYIDYKGIYNPDALAKVVGIKAGALKALYLEYKAAYDAELDVYYFPGSEPAGDCIKRIMAEIKPDNSGRAVYLTEQEIQYIRQALINEGVNTIKLKNKIKDNIFKKLNNSSFAGDGNR